MEKMRYVEIESEYFMLEWVDDISMNLCMYVCTYEVATHFALAILNSYL